ncbi:MAG: hypothetical protein ACI9LY_004022 [Arenicella sp.]|jgi:hypothetical protein
MTIKDLDRRKFGKIAAFSIAAIPLLVNAQPEDKKLAEDDPMAVALGYKENSTEVDSQKYSNHADAQLCSGCSLYVASDDAWGGCAIFPGKLVAANGWCTAYAAKPS